MKQFFSVESHSVGKTSFCSNLINMIKFYNNSNFNLDMFKENKIIYYISYLQNALQHSTKLEFYNIYKNQYKPSHCLDHTRKANERKVLVKCMTGNHNL